MTETMVPEPARNVPIGAIVNFRMPSDDELRESFTRQYERASHTFIDRWPEHLRALSFPTVPVPVDAGLVRRIWEEEGDEAAEELAAMLDAHMGWRLWFVRLNSRSPKDASYPELPITCSGKQAVWWIRASERCLDDTVMFFHAGRPMFVCLREWANLLPDLEFRCFAKGGEVLGVSRYFHDTEPKHRFDQNSIMEAARRFYAAHLTEYPDIVFDLYAPGQSEERLIEINPYGLSNPCLFGSYAEIENVGGVRLSKLNGGSALTDDIGIPISGSCGGLSGGSEEH